MGKNKIIAIIVCYKCKKGNRTLYKCKNKTDYICSFCEKIYGDAGPEIGNQSKIYSKKEEKTEPLTTPEKSGFIIPRST